jgi:hypothetical protein
LWVGVCTGDVIVVGTTGSTGMDGVTGIVVGSSVDGHDVAVPKIKDF